MLVRAKEAVVFTFGRSCWVSVCPQQKWVAAIGNVTVKLNRKNITFEIDKADFEKTFKVMEE